MEFNILLLAVLTLILNCSFGTTDQSTVNVDCLDTAYCALIKGDIAKESDKYGKDPQKFYKEAQDFLAKAVEFNNSKNEAVLKTCQDAHKTCLNESTTMAVDGLKFPRRFNDVCTFESYSRTIFGCKNLMSWPDDVRKALPDRVITCRAECIVEDGQNYTLSNGKALNRVPDGDDSMKKMDLPEGLEPRLRKHGSTFILPNTRVADVWVKPDYPLFASLNGAPKFLYNQIGTNTTSWNDPIYNSSSSEPFTFGFQELCPPNSWVNSISNFIPGAEVCIPFHLDFVCRTKEELGGPIERSEGHIVSRTARNLEGVDVSRKPEQSEGYYSVQTRDQCNVFSYSRWRVYEDCNNADGTTKHTFVTGISITRNSFSDSDVINKNYPGRIDPLQWVNFLCGDSKKFKTHGPPPQSESTEVMKCPEKMAVCGLQTRTGRITFTKYSIGDILTMYDARIGCCAIDPTFITINPTTPPVTTPPNPIPNPNPNPNPNPPPVDPKPPITTGTGEGEGEEGIYTLQKTYYLFWAGVLLDTITRYNYFYTPNTLQNERDWVTTKCADGTFVNGFEVTNPVSTYFWTRRVMMIKFKCGAVDGSKSNELDLYGRLRSGIFTLQQPDLTEKSHCAGGYYTSMEIIYYLDKKREKLAVVNAWGINMKCSKGGNTEAHKHDINSSSKNTIADNVVKNGVVDCGSGKAICGFSNTITENRKGNFEGLYFRVICCSV